MSDKDVTSSAEEASGKVRARGQRQMGAKPPKPKKEAKFVKAAFGAANRARLIDLYFADRGGASSGSAAEHIYRLLLWIDQTTGLAHCYESDKSQPGKNWYGRSLAFHDWLSRFVGAEPSKLAEEVDWLFRKATADLATEVVHRSQALLASAQRQRQPYQDRGMPQPGEDPELIAIIREMLGEQLTESVTREQWQLLVQKIRQYLMLENKRKNLVGEGFEDVIASVIRRAPGGATLDVRVRNLLHDLPGFNRMREGDKPNKVDLAVIRPDSGLRTLVTAKWSVRADREKQFAFEFTEYVNAESSRKPFNYVFVTNEFDPARLMRACEALAGNQLMFTDVVHIAPEAIRATYGASSEETMRKVVEYIDQGRLLGVNEWIAKLTGS
jgi:hypothetical protein